MDVKLIMFKNSGQRKEFPILNPTTVIGRAENCDLQVPLLSVSRRHCEVTLERKGVKVKDLASSNGTYVNNSRVTERALAAGDRLAVGPIVFTLQIDGKPEAIKPVKTRGQLLAEKGGPGVAEVVDLEEDVVAQPGASALMEPPEIEPLEAVGSDSDTADLDPISALEALASETDEDEEKK